MRLCEIFLHGIKCGTLQEDDNKEYSFTYDRAYLLGENAEPVSLTLPYRSGMSHITQNISFRLLRICFPKERTGKFSHSFSE